MNRDYGTVLRAVHMRTLEYPTGFLCKHTNCEHFHRKEYQVETVFISLFRIQLFDKF